MTGLAEHPASARLALLALCGDLVVAIDAMSIREIRRAAETPAREVDGGFALDLEGALVPSWPLGALLGIEAAPSAWVIVELPGPRLVGLGLGRCVTVQPLPVCRALPRSIFAGRSQALAAAFSTAAIPELADHVSGVVVDLSCLLAERELAFVARLGKGARAATLEA